MTEDRGTTGPPARPTSEPPRAYVGLLTEVMTNTLDEDYATVADKRRRSGATRPTLDPARRMALLAAIVVFGLLIGVSALKTDQDRPETEAERAELIDQIHKRQDDQAALSRSINAVSRRRDSAPVDGRRRRVTQLARSSPGSRASGVGPARWRSPARAWRSPSTTRRSDRPGSGGVDPRHRPAEPRQRPVEAGAEAIAINGHRLTSLTAIRFAGEAITVDYVSLTPPYEVAAIGDPDTLPARLLETDGGQTWLGLQANFGITFDRGQGRRRRARRSARAPAVRQAGGTGDTRMIAVFGLLLGILGRAVPRAVGAGVAAALPADRGGGRPRRRLRWPARLPRRHLRRQGVRRLLRVERPDRRR